MRWVRSAVFNVGLWSWAILVGVGCLPVLLGPQAWVQAIVLMWSRGAVAWARMWMGIDYVVVGAEHIPAGPCIIAAKHQSAWETFALLTIFPDTRVVLKRSLLWLPFIGWYLHGAGHLAIDRTGSAATLRDMLARLTRLKAANTKLLIFPEGTRVLPGQAPPLLVGALGLAKLARLPIVPVALDSGHVWPRNGFVKQPGLITVLISPPLKASMEKAALLAALHAAINAGPAAPSAGFSRPNGAVPC